MSDIETSLMERLYDGLKDRIEDDIIVDVSLNYEYQTMIGGGGEYKPTITVQFNRKSEVGEEIFLHSDIRIKVKCNEEFDKLKLEVFGGLTNKIDAKCKEWHFSDPNFSINDFVNYATAIIK